VGGLDLLALADGFFCRRDFIRTPEFSAQKLPPALPDLRNFFIGCISSEAVNPDALGSPLP
jgi:hypothetical protein